MSERLTQEEINEQIKQQWEKYASTHTSNDHITWGGHYEKGSPVYKMGSLMLKVRQEVRKINGVPHQKDMWYSYTCDNRLCVNPDHLGYMDPEEVKARARKHTQATKAANRAAKRQIARPITHLAHKPTDKELAAILVASGWFCVPPETLAQFEVQLLPKPKVSAP